ncbi:LysE/ArgO family amino acid transporter [Eleftheria terrae]|uniref:LysE/ArgO family amino acid transporter n=1 Tax=Eleftheria terrae TaxID=1597781 RepID=UPI00263AF1AD|nr:LysE family transporter [Eleftheria terrae]WKB55786.1 LysE family transporter [Eleftheria terrae]
MFDFLAFVQGFALGLGMFVFPGPKDILVLREALKRRPIGELLAVSVGSDALLIFLGVTGISIALRDAPAAQHAAMWIGVGLMLWHGIAAIRRAIHSKGDQAARVTESESSGRTALLVTSFLNPIAWMDTVLVIGAAGALLPSPAQLSYGVGAVSASAVWFIGLTCGAHYAGRLLTKPGAWRVLDGLVAVVMIVLALYMAQGLV